MELLLFLILVVLWLIYAKLKECLAQLKQMGSPHIDLASIIADRSDRIGNDLTDLNQKVANLENVAEAFYDQEIKARRGY